MMCVRNVNIELNERTTMFIYNICLIINEIYNLLNGWKTLKFDDVIVKIVVLAVEYAPVWDVYKKKY